MLLYSFLLTENFLPFSDLGTYSFCTAFLPLETEGSKALSTCLDTTRGRQTKIKTKKPKPSNPPHKPTSKLHAVTERKSSYAFFFHINITQAALILAHPYF